MYVFIYLTTLSVAQIVYLRIIGRRVSNLLEILFTLGRGRVLILDTVLIFELRE